MAKRMHVVLEDDLDGSEATQSLSFTMDGVEYEIDVNDEHAAQLREAFAPWVGAARRVGGRKNTRSATSSTKGELVQIREWARAQGMQVSERGRISTEVRDAYAAAH